MHVPARSLIDSAALLEALNQKCIAGELSWPAGEVVLDVILSLDCPSPVHAAREEPLVALGDCQREGCPSARHEGTLLVVEELYQPLVPLSPKPVEVHREPEALLGGAGDQGGEHLAGLNVEGGCGHEASVLGERLSQSGTTPAPHGTGLTLDDVLACGTGVLDDISLEADLAREQTLGDFAALIDYRAKWKRDAVNAFSARLRAAAKQI
jgi:hypothetical protein